MREMQGDMQGNLQARVATLRREPSPRLAEPQLYLSSLDAGWDDLCVEAFHEPAELDCWLQPVTAAVSLILFTGGPLHVEQRQPDGSWRGQTFHHGQFMLNSGRSRPLEVRWRSVSTVPTETVHLELPRELVLGAIGDIGSVPAERLALPRLALPNRAGFHDPLLAQVALELRQELATPTPAGKAFAHSAAQLLAVHLARAYTKGDVCEQDALCAPGQLTARQIEQVEKHIQRHLSEDVSVEALARVAGFSPYHFARLFRRTTGSSPHQWVVRQRVARAQWLLQQTELPLAQVAVTCGFADQSHLTLVLKQQLGCTPGACRRRGDRLPSVDSSDA
jgi:AraC family transcriptional regulator